MMTPDELKVRLQAEVKKTELELKAKKMLLKQASRKPSTPFIETKFARGLNHFLAFISTPCAVTNRNARMKLDHPRTYRAEVVIDKAESLLSKLEKETREIGLETNKLAALAALHETMLTEFSDMEGYQERIHVLRTRLAEQVERLRMPVSGPAADVTNSIVDLMEQLKKDIGSQEPSPSGA